MHLATKVAYNTIVQILSKVVTTILGLLAVAVMARYLGPAGFGEYTTIVTFLSFFGIMADLGLTLVTVQMISQPGADENKILNNLFSLRLFSALGFLSLAPIAILFFPYSQGVRAGVAIAVFSFFFIALNQIFVGFFQKKLRMDKVAIAETAGRIVLIIGTVASAHWNFGLGGMMWAIVAGSAINFVLLYIFSFRMSAWRFSFDSSLWGEIAKKSWPLAVTIFFNLLYLKTDILVLSLVKSSRDVGIYGAAYKVIDVLTVVPFMFAGVILPILTADWASNNKERFQRVLQKSFDLMVIIAIPLVVGAQFVARPLIEVVAGNDFSAAGSVLKILVYAAGLVFISSFLSHVIVAIGQQRKIIWAYFFTAATSVAGYLIFIPRFSYFGAAAVTIYSEAAITVFMIFYVLRYAGFFPRLMIFLKSSAAAVMMGLIMFLIPAGFYDKVWGLFLAMFAAVVVYFSVLYAVKGISENDIARLLNRKIEGEKF